MKLQADRETEIKFYVLDLEKIEGRLQELGALLIQMRTFEINFRFDLPDGRLRKDGRVLRLRQDQSSILTYKGASTYTDGVLSRVEYEFTVSDLNAARQTLEALGYQMIAVYEKFRRIYEFENSHIMLDELPYGNFIEIEGEHIEAIHQIADRLNLDVLLAVPTSYLKLFEQVCPKFNLDPTRLTFEAFDNLEVSPRELGVSPADR